VRVVALAKDVRITSRKARVVADSVVGLPVAEALVLLNFTPRHAAREIAKVIKSAAANAEHNYNLDTSSLRVERIDVDQAGIIKRYIAKPRGMAGSVFKRMSHLRCYVTDEEPEEGRRRRSAVAMPGRALRPSTRPAATRRRRPAQVQRAQEAAAAAEAEEAEAQAEAPEGEVAEAWAEGPEVEPGTERTAAQEAEERQPEDEGAEAAPDAVAPGLETEGRTTPPSSETEADAVAAEPSPERDGDGDEEEEEPENI
jgi:large subunit ribosomal protein L22